MSQQDNKDFWLYLLVALKNWWFFIAVLVMSMLMKFYTMMKYRKDITFMEFWVEFILSAFGTALTLFVMIKLKFDIEHPVWFSGVGSLSGICMAQLAKIVSKETSPILELIIAQIKNFIKSKKQ